MSQESRIAFASPVTLIGREVSALLLAFSGGADSRALLHLLAHDATERGYRLLLAHVNHGIRGDEALRDRDFCERIAKRYGLEICFLDADVPALARESGRGLEEEAREVRYAFLKGLMHEKKIPVLATAHHADDNLETVLFRLSRGSTGQGLCGIAPIRAFGEGFLVRPLLGATRGEILAYCRDHALEYVSDSTNADTHYARNRLRAEVVPVMQGLFPAVQKRTLALCEELRQDEALLQSLADRLLKDACADGAPSLAILRTAEPPVLRRALRSYLVSRTQTVPERVHLGEVMHLVQSGKNGDRTALPQGYFAASEGDRLVVFKPFFDEVRDFELPFALGRTDLPDSGIVIRVEMQEENRKVHNLSTTACINLTELSAIMKSALYWRNYREGDTLLAGGMHKRLRKLWNQHKVPARLRCRLPLLCDAEGILWAPFAGVRDGIFTDGKLLVSVELPKDEERPCM